MVIPALSFPPLKEFLTYKIPFQIKAPFLNIVNRFLLQSREKKQFSCCDTGDYNIEDIFTYTSQICGENFNRDYMNFLFNYYYTSDALRFVLKDMVIKNDAIKFRHSPEELVVGNDSEFVNVTLINNLRSCLYNIGTQYIIPLLVYDDQSDSIDLSDYCSSIKNLQWLACIPGGNFQAIKIKSINLSKCTLIPDNEFENLSLCYKLESVILDYLTITPKIMNYIKELKVLKSLSLKGAQISTELALRMKSDFNFLENLNIKDSSLSNETTVNLLKKNYSNVILINE